MFGLTEICSELYPVGSRATCNPPPMDTDEDYLAFVLDAMEADRVLTEQGYVTTTDHDYEGMESEFVSYKKGEINIIVTEEIRFFRAFMAATHVAKRLNIMKKSDRIALFQAVLYKRQWSE